LYFPAAGLYENKVLKQSNKNDVLHLCQPRAANWYSRRDVLHRKNRLADAVNEGVGLILLTKN
jgi:hypothetical protein